jgi:hypothetical protein
MSGSRLESPLGSEAVSKSDNEEFVVIDISHENLQTHALEIATLKKSHADEIVKLKKSYDDKLVTLIESFEEKAANDVLRSSAVFRNPNSADQVMQVLALQDLQLKFDQLQAEHEVLKAQLTAAETAKKELLAAAETKNSAQKPFIRGNRFGFYNPIFYPFPRNLRPLTGLSILPLQQLHQPDQEQALENNKSTSSSATIAPPSPR